MSNIRKNFLYSSILTTANYIFPFLTYPYVSRVLGVDNIGICNFVDSIINYFILFSMLGISSVGIREIAKGHTTGKLNDTFNGLFWFIGFCTILAAIALIISIYNVPQLYKHKNLMFIGVLKLISNFLLIEWLFKGLEDFKYITQRTLIIKMLYVISVFFFIKEKSDYPIYYLLLTLMITANAICNCIYARKYIRIRFPKSISNYAKPLFIMGIYALLTNMYTTFNTTFLGFKCGETQVGYFSTATKIFSIIISLYSAFTGVMLPRMSSLLAEGNHSRFSDLLHKSVDILLSMSIPLIMFSIFCAADIIQLISGEGYEGAILPMQICMPLIFIIGYEQIIIVQGLLPLRKDKAVMINSAVGAVVGIIGCFIFITHYQSIGASFVWIISELCVLTSASIFIYRFEHFSFPFLKLFKSILQHSPLCIALYLTSQIQINVFTRLLLNGAILCIYCFILQYYFIKQEAIVKLINTIYSKIK